MTALDVSRRSTENLKTVRATFPAKFEARNNSDGTPSGLLIGYASVTEHPYLMRDMFGEYEEVISKGAFLKTLSENPNVRYLVNHSGLSHGTTLNGALTLTEDDLGLRSEMQLDMRRTDSQDLWFAVESGAADRMSFMFEIMRQGWSADWLFRRIDEVRMADGDVSVVNFPANPAATVGARSKIKELQKARKRAGDLADRLKRGTLDANDLAVLAAAMAVLVEADDALDPLVVALTTADDALEEAASAISAVTGIPSPIDSDEMSIEEALASL
jgi:HK97 family phage prohead protease